MIERASGLILRTRPLTETSLIANWLTADQGRISTVAKGALRPKSPYRGKLDLFFLADFTFTRSRRSDLHTLVELRLSETHQALRQDLASLRAAAYAASLLEQTTERDTPLPGMLEMMLGFVRSLLSKPELNAQKVFAFELRLLAALGLEPDFEESRISPPTVEVIEQLTSLSWPEIEQVQVSTDQAVELRRFLHGFLIYQFGRLARGREAALSGEY